VRLSDMLIESLQPIRHRPLRTSLTVLGVSIAAALIVVLISQTSGLSQAVEAQVSRVGASTIILRPTGLVLDDSLVAQVSSIQGVSFAAGMIVETRSIVLSTGRTTAAQVLGVEPSMIPLIFPGAVVEQGSMLETSDYWAALLGADLYQSSPSEPAVPLGSIILVGREALGEVFGLPWGLPAAARAPTGGGDALLVKGVLGRYGSGFTFSIDSALVTNLNTARQIAPGRSGYSLVVVGARRVEDVEAVLEGVGLLLGSGVRITAPFQTVNALKGVVDRLSFYGVIIASVSMLVAGLNIMNVMYISVLERYRVIGVLKALGATGRTVLALHLVEAGWMGALGGAVGSAMGVILSLTVSDLLGAVYLTMLGTPVSVQPIFSPESFVAVMLFSTAMSIGAGVYPAWKASRLEPVAALRHE